MSARTSRYMNYEQFYLQTVEIESCFLKGKNDIASQEEILVNGKFIAGKWTVSQED